MMNCAIGASWVFPGGSGSGLSESIAVRSFRVAVSLRPFLDFEPS